MPADAVSQYLEATMMICFGVSWPMAILKTWRTKKVSGKSLPFLLLIFFGYVAGIAAKLVQAGFHHTRPGWVTALYAANAILVAVDVTLYLKYRKAE